MRSFNNDDNSYRIRQAFNRSSATYDDHCLVQKTSSELMVKHVLSVSQTYDVIAEMGCGTGQTTRFILDNIDFKCIYSVDHADLMVAKASSRVTSKKVRFIVSDFDKPMFKESTLDAIFTNMSLQWSANILNSLMLFKSYLKDGGLFAFTVPLEGSFIEIVNKQNINILHNEMTWLDWLDQVGFQLISYEHHSNYLEFESPCERLLHFKHIGANTCISVRELTSSISRSSYRDMQQPISSRLTYRVGIFVCIKRCV